ncbi:MAG: hypothetical protein CMM52_14065 [Rhodospirillaceae bacterium]|nr:hypothetical protein [Rhodospirillaceae bacterium]|tara:strand:- start:32272 stop:32823 length:552 start_codon:yes stop_codon:yes gene_type:complete
MNRRISQRLSQLAVAASVVLCAFGSAAYGSISDYKKEIQRSEIFIDSEISSKKVSARIEIAQRRRDRRGGPRFRRPPRRNDLQLRSPPEEVLERRRIRRLRNQQRRNREQDNARDAVRSGRALPLSSIIQGVQASCPGRFLGARLIRRGDQLAYRLNILRPSGQRVTMFVDAANGSVVRGSCR